jgi:hypothetical protein
MPINYSNYHPDWKAISERIRFERANNHCEKCGAENYTPNPITGSRVILTVAHLDHDIANNEDSNLMAMCQLCHNRYDAPMRAAKRKAKRGAA